MMGVMNTDEARRLARSLDLDLVEVNPKASPPVCKIMDFGKFKYEEKKKQNEARKRQTQIALKEIKLRPKTDDHDVEFTLELSELGAVHSDLVHQPSPGEWPSHPDRPRVLGDPIVRSGLSLSGGEPRLDGRTVPGPSATSMSTPPYPSTRRSGEASSRCAGSEITVPETAPDRRPGSE